MTGRITVTTAPALGEAIRRAVADMPQAVICDLSETTVVDPSCAGVFLDATASGTPDVAVSLCCASRTVRATLRRLGLDRFVQISATLGEALHPSRLRSPQTVQQFYPVAAAQAARDARLFVGGHCDGEGLTAIRDDAVLATSELVTNGLLHARTDLLLQLKTSATSLVVSVRDWGPPLMRAVRDEVAEGGRGLDIVQALADAWGHNRHPDGGKVVWCSFDLEAAASAVPGPSAPGSTAAGRTASGASAAGSTAPGAPLLAHAR